MSGFSYRTDAILAAIFLSSKACFVYPLLVEAYEYKRQGEKPRKGGKQ